MPSGPLRSTCSKAHTLGNCATLPDQSPGRQTFAPAAARTLNQASREEDRARVRRSVYVRWGRHCKRSIPSRFSCHPTSDQSRAWSLGSFVGQVAGIPCLLAFTCSFIPIVSFRWRLPTPGLALPCSCLSGINLATVSGRIHYVCRFAFVFPSSEKEIEVQKILNNELSATYHLRSPKGTQKSPHCRFRSAYSE